MNAVPHDRSVIFRCDASREIGGGHVSRCIALAEAMEDAGWECQFASVRGSEEIVPRLHEFSTIELPPIEANDPFALAERIGRQNRLIAIDGYGFSLEYESSCRTIGEKVLVIDDLANRRHECDFLVNPSPMKSTTDLSTIIDSKSTLLLGPQFSMVRKEIARRRPEARRRRFGENPAARVLISLGASAVGSIGVEVARKLLDMNSQIEIEISHPNQSLLLSDLAIRHPARISIHRYIKDMAEAMVTADVAVGAGGGTTWERCTLGLPTVAISIAENQRENIEGIVRSGAAISVTAEVNKENSLIDDIVDEILSLLSDPKRRRKVSESAFRLCDGRGLLRIQLALAGSGKDRRGRNISLRLVEKADSDTILMWQSREGARRYFRNPEKPTKEQHTKWIESAVDEVDSFISLILCDGQPCGLLQLRRRMDGVRLKSWEVSILVDSLWQGNGIASNALQMARRLIPAGEIFAFVNSENTVSVRLFLRCGYEKISKDLYRSAS